MTCWRKGRKERINGDLINKKRSKGKKEAAGRAREGLYERGHWPGGGATWDPVLQHPDRALPPATRPAVIIISLTPAATLSLAWHLPPPYRPAVYTSPVPRAPHLSALSATNGKTNAKTTVERH